MPQTRKMKISGEFEIRKYQVSYELETERPKGKFELTLSVIHGYFRKLIGREST